MQPLHHAASSCSKMATASLKAARLQPSVSFFRLPKCHHISRRSLRTLVFARFASRGVPAPASGGSEGKQRQQHQHQQTQPQPRSAVPRQPRQGAPQPAAPLVPAGERRYYATCHPGLEEVVARELSSPHIRARLVCPGKAGVSFVGDAATGYRAVLWLRSAIRVLQFLGEAPLDPRRPGGDEVYRAVREAAPWARLLAPRQSFSVEARVRSCGSLTNSQLLVVRAKDAICDTIRDLRGAKPAPPEPGRAADLPLYCTAFQDKLTLFRDLCGVSLHRRGYRRAMHRASLNESAAAGLLYLAGWDELCMAGGDAAVLADPMCGSGTLLIEAALMASSTAPGLFRPTRAWPFHGWPDFDRRAWAAAHEEAAAARRAPLPGVALWGNDVHAGALALAQRDIEAARVAPVTRLHCGGCRDWALPAPPQLVVCNPPWGQRLMGGDAEEEGSPGRGRGVDGWWEEGAEGSQDTDGRPGQEAAALAQCWHDLSVFLKEQCGGAQACLLSGNAEATQHLRLRAEKKWALSIGGVDCRLLKYSIRGRGGGGGRTGGGSSSSSNAGGEEGVGAVAARGPEPLGAQSAAGEGQ